MFVGFRIEAVLRSTIQVWVCRAAAGDTGQRVRLAALARQLALIPIYRERFLSRAAAAREVVHSALLRVLAVGEQDLAFATFEHANGPDLASRLEDHGPLPPEHAVELAAQLAAGLDALGAAGMPHLDVTTANVTLLEDGEPGEFRVLLAPPVATLPPEQETAGGPGPAIPMPASADVCAVPELLRGEACDTRADVYALGVVLWESLTGKQLFAREQHTRRLFAHLEEPAPAVSDLRPDLPRALDAALLGALAKAPGDRPSSPG